MVDPTQTCTQDGMGLLYYAVKLTLNKKATRWFAVILPSLRWTQSCDLTAIFANEIIKKKKMPHHFTSVLVNVTTWHKPKQRLQKASQSQWPREHVCPFHKRLRKNIRHLKCLFCNFNVWFCFNYYTVIIWYIYWLLRRTWDSKSKLHFKLFHRVCLNTCYFCLVSPVPFSLTDKIPSTPTYSIVSHLFAFVSSWPSVCLLNIFMLNFSFVRSKAYPSTHTQTIKRQAHKLLQNWV